MHAASGRLSALRPPLIGVGKKKKKEKWKTGDRKTEGLVGWAKAHAEQ
jgi:hypothetical protein